MPTETDENQHGATTVTLPEIPRVYALYRDTQRGSPEPDQSQPDPSQSDQAKLDRVAGWVFALPAGGVVIVSRRRDGNPTCDNLTITSSSSLDTVAKWWAPAASAELVAVTTETNLN